jgi:hypothetical protein
MDDWAIRSLRTEGKVTQMDSRLEWHPTEAEVQAIIEELQPVLAAISERQRHQMAAPNPAPPRSHPG